MSSFSFSSFSFSFSSFFFFLFFFFSYTKIKEQKGGTERKSKIQNEKEYVLKNKRVEKVLVGERRKWRNGEG
jgi:hypothetical protein